MTDVERLTTQLEELDAIKWLIKDRRTVGEAIQFIQIREESLERKRNEAHEREAASVARQRARGTTPHSV